MKKSRMILGASAVVLAIASAFTTKSKTTTTVWTGGIFSNGGVPGATVCTKYTVDCALGGELTIFTQGVQCSQGTTVFSKYTAINGCQQILHERQEL